MRKDSVKNIIEKLNNADSHKLSGSLSGISTICLGKDNTVYKMIKKENSPEAAEERFKNEVCNTQFLKENRLNVADIREVGENDALYILTKEYLGEDIESLLKNKTNEIDTDKLFLNFGKYIKTVHSLDISEYKGSENPLHSYVPEQHKKNSRETNKNLLNLLENPPEKSVILDARLSNFVLKENELFCIDADSIGLGDPMLDLAWLYSELNLVNALNSNAEESKKMFAKVMEGYGQISSEQEQRLNTYKDTYFQMPRESKLQISHPFMGNNTKCNSTFCYENKRTIDGIEVTFDKPELITSENENGSVSEYFISNATGKNPLSGTTEQYSIIFEKKDCYSTYDLQTDKDNKVASGFSNELAVEIALQYNLGPVLSVKD